MSKNTDYTKINRTETDRSHLDERAEEESRVRRDPLVAPGEAIEYKKPLGKRIADTMFGEDGVISYIGGEIIMPAIKTLIVDSVYSAVTMSLFGRDAYYAPPSSRVPWDTNRDKRGKYTDYQGVSTTRYRYGGTPETQARNDNVRASNRVPEFTMPSREIALGVLQTMSIDAETYGYVTVADYYDLIGMQANYTDNNWGWHYEDMKHATIVPAHRGAYLIKLPRPVEV